jgi:hypothetical protein
LLAECRIGRQTLGADHGKDGRIGLLNGSIALLNGGQDFGLESGSFAVHIGLKFDSFDGGPEGIKCRVIHRGAVVDFFQVVGVIFVVAEGLGSGRTIRVFRVRGPVLGPFGIRGDLATVSWVWVEFRSSENKSFGFLRLIHDAKTITCWDT